MKCIKCGKEMRPVNTTGDIFISIEYLLCDECDTICEIKCDNNFREIVFYPSVSGKYEKFDDSCMTRLNELLDNNTAVGFNNMKNLLDTQNKAMEEVYNELLYDKFVIMYKDKNDKFITTDIKPVYKDGSIQYTIDLTLDDIDIEKDLIVLLLDKETGNTLSVKTINHDSFNHGDKFNIIWSFS
jgi:transcription elongation factor Elf1